MKVINKITEKRVLKGMTQLQLCKKLREYGDNCNQCEISSYETGERYPSLPRLLLITMILKCKVEDLYFIDEL